MAPKRKRSTSDTSPRQPHSRPKFNMHLENCRGSARDVELLKKRLIRHPEELNVGTGGCVPLIDAVDKLHLECVRQLLAAGANPNAQQNKRNPILHLALSPQNYDQRPVREEIFKLLLAAGANVNALCLSPNGQFPIFVLLAQMGLEYYHLIEMCFDYGANADSFGLSRTQNSVTLLYLVTISAHPKIVRLFLDKGADPNKLALVGRHNHPGDELRAVYPPICAGIMVGRIQVVKELLLHNANTDIGNMDPYFNDTSLVGITFLSRTCCHTRAKILDMLYKFGCNMRPTQHEHFDLDNDSPCIATLSKYAKQPLSLLQLSRVAILHAMGQQYLTKIKTLEDEVPTTVYDFLEFSDVDTTETEPCTSCQQ